MNNDQKLVCVKSLHTAIWIFFNIVIFYMLYAAIVGKLDVWLWLCYGLVLAEGIVLLIFRLVCPLTLIARKYSASDKDNFDIFLPNWLARYTKLIYTSLVGLTLVITIIRLIVRSK